MKIRATLNDGSSGIIAPNSIIGLLTDLVYVNQEGIVEDVKQAVINTPIINVCSIETIEDEGVKSNE